MKRWILLAALLMAGCSDGDGGDGTTTAPMPVRTDHVEVQDAYFQPQVVLVSVGQTISWTNHGRVPHTVTADDASHWGTEGSGSAERDYLQPDETWLWVFSEPGEYHYHCIPHATERDGQWRGMVGTVIVE